LNPDLVKGAWTKVEDDLIMELVAKHGPTKWSMIAQSLPGRIGKQCRERQVFSSNMNVISHFSLCCSTYSPLDPPFAATDLNQNFSFTKPHHPCILIQCACVLETDGTII